MSAHANATQVGGSHYKSMRIQPWDAAFANVLLWPEGEIIKWVSRWKSKGGVNDLRKAEHLIAKMIFAATHFDWPNRPLTDLELAQLMNLDVTPRDEERGTYAVHLEDQELRVSPETEESALSAVRAAMAACSSERVRVDAVRKSIASTAAYSTQGAAIWESTSKAIESLADAYAQLAFLKSLILEARPHE